MQYAIFGGKFAGTCHQLFVEGGMPNITIAALAAAVPTLTEKHGIFPLNEVDAIILTAILAAIVAVWGIRNQWAITRRQLTLQQLSSKDSDKDMIDARQTFIRLAKDPSGLVTWSNPDKEASKEVEAIRLVLNDFELTAIGCQLNIIDYTIMERYQKSAVLKYWFYAAPFVYALRARLGKHTIYHEFEELARCMADSTPPKRSFGFSARLFLRKKR